jgi:hypothetical protein
MNHEGTESLHSLTRHVSTVAIFAVQVAGLWLMSRRPDAAIQVKWAQPWPDVVIFLLGLYSFDFLAAPEILRQLIKKKD